jgi:hypothetical protein
MTDAKAAEHQLRILRDRDDVYRRVRFELQKEPASLEEGAKPETPWKTLARFINPNKYDDFFIYGIESDKQCPDKPKAFIDTLIIDYPNDISLERFCGYLRQINAVRAAETIEKGFGVQAVFVPERVPLPEAESTAQ